VGLDPIAGRLVAVDQTAGQIAGLGQAVGRVVGSVRVADHAQAEMDWSRLAVGPNWMRVRRDFGNRFEAVRHFGRNVVRTHWIEYLVVLIGRLAGRLAPPGFRLYRRFGRRAPKHYFARTAENLDLWNSSLRAQDGSRSDPVRSWIELMNQHDW